MIRLSALLVLALALTACDRSSNGPRAEGPSLIALDSIRLQETDSLYIGQPKYLVSDSDGAFYISDSMSGHVLQFAPDGSLIRSFGKKGKGPGELGSPFPLAMVGDSMLAVGDLGNAQLTLYVRSTGAFVRSLPIGGIHWSMQASGDTVLMGVVNPGPNTSMAAWWPTADSVIPGGTLPAEYLATWPLLVNHSNATLAILGDTVLIGFSGHGAFFLTRRDGTVFDTVSVPVVRRRGVPSDIAARFAAKPLENEEVVAMTSLLWGLQRLASDEVAVFYLDGTYSDGGVTGDGFVSILSKDLKRACVDAQIKMSPDNSRPVVAFRGDTLLSVEQHIVSTTKAQTYLNPDPAFGVDPGLREA